MVSVQYVTDASGKALFVQIPIDEFEKLLADAEAYDDIRAYDEAKRNAGKSIPFDQAFADIDKHHSA